MTYRIAVVGAGGVGGYFGGRLAAGGADVTFVVRGQTLAALRERGLRVESIDGDFEVVPVQAVDKPDGPFQAVLMTVKAWQLHEAAALIQPSLDDQSIVVPLQNGIDAPEQLVSVLGRGPVSGGLCALISYVVAPGLIRHTGGAPFLMFGELDNRPSERVLRLREAMRSAGVNAEIAQDIQKSMWSKFAFITPMSAVGAATRAPIGTWRSMTETRQLAREVLDEVLALAAARGIGLEEDAVERTMQRYDSLPPDSTSSLQRDVISGRPSELEAQLGAAVRLGRESGVPTPLLQALYATLLAQERIARGTL